MLRAGTAGLSRVRMARGLEGEVEKGGLAADALLSSVPGSPDSGTNGARRVVRVSGCLSVRWRSATGRGRVP